MNWHINNRVRAITTQLTQDASSHQTRLPISSVHLKPWPTLNMNSLKMYYKL